MVDIEVRRKVAYQFGSTRSINSSAAAAIAMHGWVRQHTDRGSGEAWRG